jgi:hypothetical protein
MFTDTSCEAPNYYYEAIQVDVVESGCYNLTSNSTYDTYAYIYKGNFNPISLTSNLLSENDQSGYSNQFELIISLQVNTTYVLVVTTVDSRMTGIFSVIVTGPNNVSLNRISEYF